MKTLSSSFSKEPFLISLVIFVSTLFLLYGIDSLSIKHSEAYIYFNTTGLLHEMVNFSTSILGQNDFGLRMPFVIFHIASIVLLYKISKRYLKRKGDRVTAVIVYSLLPGVNSAALLVNSSAIVIFATLLFVFLYLEEKRFLAYAVLMFSIFIDNSFSILYLSLVFYSIYKRENTLFYISLVFFALSMYTYGFDSGGKPKGFFIDTLGVYAAIFSPFIFLYFFYSHYRILIKEEKSIIWFISFTSLIFSLLLAFRQKIMIEDFAPFVVISAPLMVRVFFSSYRVRLPQMRKIHKLFMMFVVVTLSINFLATFFNKYIYLFIDNPKKHFAYKYHFAKELSEELKKMGIKGVVCEDYELALRLQFYEINPVGDYLLRKNKQDEFDKKVTIGYINKPLIVYYVSKIYN